MDSAHRNGRGGRSGGGGGRVFVDFDPPYEFTQTEEEDVFVVQLPGFEKEQLTVRAKRDRKVAISGERPLPDNRWSRFHKEFPVPTHCNTQAIAANFDGGILYLVLPKSPPPSPLQIPNREQQQRPPQQIPNGKQQNPPPSSQPQTTPSSKPPKQSDEEKKTKEEPIRKDYYGRPSKRSDEEERKRKEELIKKDYHDRPKDGGDIGDRLQNGKREEWLIVATTDRDSRIELGNLKLMIGSLELELHRSKQLVKGLVVVLVVGLGIAFYWHYKLKSSK